MKKQPNLVSIFAARDFEVHRHAQPGTSSTPCNPERVTLLSRRDGCDVELVGQDATDLLDQLTHAGDVGHMARICADAWGINAAKVPAPAARRTMHAVTQHDAALGQGPSVQMTREEAVELSHALNDARARIVARIGAVGRKRSLTDAQKVGHVKALRKQLAVLQQFHEAHQAAHEIGGY